MTALPTGTLTFLFTDIEESTSLWERFPKGMGDALARHDEIFRLAISRRGGFVFKALGDGFCAVFASAPAALGAALDAQITVGRESWDEIGALRVRIALHTGLADLREGDYFGPTLNRVARFGDHCAAAQAELRAGNGLT